MQDRRNNRRNSSVRSLSCIVGIVFCCLTRASYAQTCWTNIEVEDPATKRVCATWDQGADPILDTDFTVSYSCQGCSDAPRVEFITGGTDEAIAWEIYSEVISTGAAANLGDVVLADNVVPNEGKFTVSIIKGPVGAGAVNVSSIVLDSSDGDWTGHSSLTPAGSFTIINGNVTGDITAIERSGNGGTAGGLWTRILGDVQGVLTIPSVTGFLQNRR